MWDLVGTQIVGFLIHRLTLSFSLLQRLDWTSKEENVVKVYQSLVLNLVSVHTDYLKSALKMLVRNFCPSK